MLSHLYLTINKSLYLVEPLECGPGAAVRAFRLNKGDGTLYDVAQTSYGPECDCPDFIFRRAGLDPSGCKHVRALVGQGLIEAGAPASVRTESGRRAVGSR
ncbi:hypothetical protein V5E97_18410 [Singulisphaera sp. Ch08]|uniref:SWIM-type domain-containing protein n=1 Tax=Singulisphaera sp. Ch08 TaxID=3120278 RepID=A0AAU7CQR7_9BACT